MYKHKECLSLLVVSCSVVQVSCQSFHCFPTRDATWVCSTVVVCGIEALC